MRTRAQIEAAWAEVKPKFKDKDLADGLALLLEVALDSRDVRLGGRGRPPLPGEKTP